MTSVRASQWMHKTCGESRTNAYKKDIGPWNEKVTITLFKLWNKIEMTVHYALYCELIVMNSSSIWILKIRNNILGQDQKVCGTFRDFSGLFHDWIQRRRSSYLKQRKDEAWGWSTAMFPGNVWNIDSGVFLVHLASAFEMIKASSLCKFPEIDISPLKIGRNRPKRNGSSSNLFKSFCC